MKPFESFLALKLEQFIIHRLALGYRDRSLRSLLRPFDRYTKENAVDWDCLGPSFFLGLRKKLRGEAGTVNSILSGVRVFFQFLVHQGYCSNNPLQDIPPLPINPYISFIFSSEEVEQLVCKIQKRFPETNEIKLKHASVYMAIILMAKCGLRISEPLRILLTHYRRTEGTIYIEKTKFQNDRLIPVPKSVLVEIEKYLEVRNSLISDVKNPYLLVGLKQKPLSKHYIYPAFHQAVKDIGIDRARLKMANVTFGSPSPHSLRHSFAVNTLRRIKEQGKSTRDALPVLAVYMGHRKVRSTGRYLMLLDAQHRQKLVDFAISYEKEI